MRRPRRRASASTTTARSRSPGCSTTASSRIAYVDVDVHHGDGVQAAFYDDPRVLTISLHQHPLTLWPGTGLAARVRRRAAPRAPRSTCRCRPARATPAGCARSTPSCRRCCAAFRPQLLVTQCGADTHREDPLADLGLSVDGHRDDLPAAARAGRRSTAGGRWLATRRRRLRPVPGGAAVVDAPDRHRARPRRRPATPRCPPGWTAHAATLTGRRAAHHDDRRREHRRTRAWGDGAAEPGRPRRPGDPPRGVPAARPRPRRPAGLTMTDRSPSADARRDDRHARPDAGPGYPAHWEADVVASDGGIVHLRPILPADADALVRFHAQPLRAHPLLALLRALPAHLAARPRAVHRRRPPRPRGVRLPARRRDHRRRPLRGAAAAGRDGRVGRGGVRRRATPTRAAGSARSCSSTSPPPPGRTGCAGSRPRCSPRTARWCGCSATPATRSAGRSPTACCTWSSTSTPPSARSRCATPASSAPRRAACTTCCTRRRSR